MGSRRASRHQEHRETNIDNIHRTSTAVHKHQQGRNDHRRTVRWEVQGGRRKEKESEDKERSHIAACTRERIKDGTPHSELHRPPANMPTRVSWSGTVPREALRSSDHAAVGCSISEELDRLTLLTQQTAWHDPALLLQMRFHPNCLDEWELLTLKPKKFAICHTDWKRLEKE